MKKIATVLLLSISMYSIAQTGTIQFSSIGLPPIPAFKKAEPVAMAFFSTNITKHLEISPDVALTAKGKLWFSDLWWRGNFFLDTAKKWLLTVGVDLPSYFGQEYTTDDGEKLDQYVLYPTGQIKMKYFLSKNLTLVQDYWYTWAEPMKYGIKGHYFSIAASWSKEIGKGKFAIASNPNVFYLNYSDGTKGFAFSCDFSITHQRSGVFIATQGLVSLNVTNLEPAANVSVGISRKLF